MEADLQQRISNLEAEATGAVALRPSRWCGPALGLVLAACGQTNTKVPDAGALPDAPRMLADAGTDADPTACLPVNATVLDPAAAGIPTAGLVVWLRADAGVSATAAGAVCSWKNQVGSEVFTPAAAAFLGTRFTSPQLVPDWMPGIPALHSGPGRGLGVRSIEGVPPTQGRTFFAVTERIDPAGRFQPIMQGLPTSDRLYVGLDQDTFNTLGKRYGAYVSGAAFDSSFATAAGSRAVESLVDDDLVIGHANASILHYFNNGSAGTLTYRGNITTVIDMTAMTTTYAACSQGADALQAEALIYARPLASAERQQVEHYLGARYGIALP